MADVGEGFRVVNQGWVVIDAAFGRIGRLAVGEGEAAVQPGDDRRFLAADVAAGGFHQLQLDGLAEMGLDAAAELVLLPLAQRFPGGGHGLGQMRIDVHNQMVSLDRHAGDEGALDDLVGGVGE